MPNHVRNVWEIKNVPLDKVKYILDRCSVVLPAAESGSIHDRIIDFDLIIPEPRIEADCPKEYIVNKSSHVAKYEDREWFNWYDWHLAHWGTKWNAYDGYTVVSKGFSGVATIEFTFNTAWSLAEPVMYKLADLGYDLDIRWADEDIGSNCGQIEYNADERVWTPIDVGDKTDFAEFLWTYAESVFDDE